MPIYGDIRTSNASAHEITAKPYFATEHCRKQDNAAFSVQFDVSGAPEGDVTYFLKVADGVTETSRGPLEDADVTVSSDYETSQAISKGELNVQMAFMTGKIKVGGNMAKIMMHQGVLNEYARVLSGLDTEY